jgi:hypothetical protein
LQVSGSRFVPSAGDPSSNNRVEPCYAMRPTQLVETLTAGENLRTAGLRQRNDAGESHYVAEVLQPTPSRRLCPAAKLDYRAHHGRAGRAGGYCPDDDGNDTHSQALALPSTLLSATADHHGSSTARPFLRAGCQVRAQNEPWRHTSYSVVPRARPISFLRQGRLLSPRGHRG